LGLAVMQLWGGKVADHSRQWRNAAQMNDDRFGGDDPRNFFEGKSSPSENPRRRYVAITPTAER
jgi:hypothetical protein